MAQPERVGVGPSPAVRIRWGLPDALVAWLVGVATTVVVAAPFVDPDQPDSQQVVALLVGLLAQSAGVVGWLALVARRKGRGGLTGDFGLAMRPRDLGWVALGLGLSLVAGLLLLPITDLAGVRASEQEVVKLFERARGLEVPFFALSVVVVAPVAEELLFRGALLRALVRLTSPTVAVLASALVFALVHFLGDEDAGLYIPAFLLLGILSGWRALRTHELSQSILLHAGFNLLAAIQILS
jgi:membrane protease YdiL (CAAX protease family)